MTRPQCASVYRASYRSPWSTLSLRASHDHNAPRLGAVTPGGLAHANTKETDANTIVTNDKIVEVVKRAKAALQPARFGLGTGIVDININRDQYAEGRGWGLGQTADRPSDKTMWVMKFETTGGQPIAILFNYAVHSDTALGTAVLTGDLGGAAERTVEQRYDGKVVALYTMGPAGDQESRVFKGKGTASGGPGGARWPWRSGWPRQRWTGQSSDEPGRHQQHI